VEQFDRWGFFGTYFRYVWGLIRREYGAIHASKKREEPPSPAHAASRNLQSAAAMPGLGGDEVTPFIVFSPWI
jgi:hypothetical protein